MRMLTICLHRNAKGGRKNWLLKVGFGCRPLFPPGEAGRYASSVSHREHKGNTEHKEKPA